MHRFQNKIEAKFSDGNFGIVVSVDNQAITGREK